MSIIIVLFILILTILLWPRKKVPKIEPKIEEPIIIEEEKPNLTEDYLFFSNFVGQEKSIEYIKGHIEKAKSEFKPLPHIILWGSGGLGKSTLIKAVATEMGGKFIEVVPAGLRNINDLYSILFVKECIYCGDTNHYSVNKCLTCKNPIKISFIPLVLLKDYDILFLEECHGLKDEIEEAMYSLMQDGYIILRYMGEDRKVFLPKITVAGATTKIGDLNKPFRDRFKISVFLTPYTEKDLSLIIENYCNHKNISITQEAIILIAKVANGIPRIAKKYILDSSTRGSIITEIEVNQILALLKVDKNGLEEIHREILNYIHVRTTNKNYGAGALAIAQSVGISQQIYLEVYEPVLLFKGYIHFGNRGRILTDKALKDYFNEKG